MSGGSPSLASPLLLNNITLRPPEPILTYLGLNHVNIGLKFREPGAGFAIDIYRVEGFTPFMLILVF